MNNAAILPEEHEPTMPLICSGHAATCGPPGPPGECMNCKAPTNDEDYKLCLACASPENLNRCSLCGEVLDTTKPIRLGLYAELTPEKIAADIAAGQNDDEHEHVGEGVHSDNYHRLREIGGALLQRQDLDFWLSETEWYHARDFVVKIPLNAFSLGYWKNNADTLFVCSCGIDEAAIFSDEKYCYIPLDI